MDPPPVSSVARKNTCPPAATGGAVRETDSGGLKAVSCCVPAAVPSDRQSCREAPDPLTYTTPPKAATAGAAPGAGATGSCRVLAAVPALRQRACLVGEDDRASVESVSWRAPAPVASLVHSSFLDRNWLLSSVATKKTLFCSSATRGLPMESIVSSWAAKRPVPTFVPSLRHN